MVRERPDIFWYNFNRMFRVAPVKISKEQRNSRLENTKRSFKVTVIRGHLGSFQRSKYLRLSTSLHHLLIMSHIVGRASEIVFFRTPDLH